jgi:prolyl oligopeptidase
MISLAVAGIRGGGEYGKAWHDAAVGTNKKVAWDDFASAARYLHEQNISTPAQTAIYGTSNGGLLVSASIVRNPQLFAVALPDVALTDLIRFHKFVSLSSPE